MGKTRLGRKLYQSSARAAYSGIRRLRQFSASSRRPPDFLIIGAQKSGTTTLFSDLVQHKLIHGALIKEVHFFDGGLDPSFDTYEAGFDWYRSHFPLKSNLQPSALTFEATPLYLFNPLVPARIKQCLGEIKLIAVLRNPVDRAISHFFHSVRYGFEELPFEQALEVEEQRIGLPAAKREFKDLRFIHNSYVSRGFYAQQLQRFYEHFPEECLHVIQAESYFNSPERELAGIADFLKIGRGLVRGTLRNLGRGKSELSPEVVSKLRCIFKQHNDDLYDLLGRRFDW